MSPAPLVSVVIPTRGRPELVTRAVRSALTQSMNDIEVVVVIDGPDPVTADALAGIDDARLRTVVLASSGGAPNARNVGAGAARGRWTAMLDDDDEWLPGKLDAQVAVARTATAEMPVVSSRLINRTPRTEYVMPRRLPEPGEPLSEYLVVRRGLFHGDGFVQTSTIMAPTALFRRVPFTVGLRRQQELDWVLRAAGHDDVQVLFAADPLVVWHQDEDRERISLGSPWQDQLTWLRASRHLFTPRAYAAFTMSVLSSMAATTRSPAVCRMLLREAREHGRPGAIDYLTFAQIWLLPPHVRHRVRDRLLGRRDAVSRPDAVPRSGDVADGGLAVSAGRGDDGRR